MRVNEDGLMYIKVKAVDSKLSNKLQGSWTEKVN
uniref:NERD domain-containing protein n=1 Tax=Rhizophora mucronata TaxID=61149 RepID=A0A2P2JT50_RHIMU